MIRSPDTDIRRRIRAFLGHFMDQDGCKMLAQNILLLNQMVRTNCPGLALVLFGHSMGSLLARPYAAERRHGRRRHPQRNGASKQPDR